MTSHETTTPASSATTGFGVRAVVAVALSVGLNAALLAVVLATGIVQPFRPLSWPPVLLLTTVGAVGAVATYWVLTRWTAAPDRLFVRLAAVLLVLSFVPDLALLQQDPAATPGAVVVLMGMHVTVAAACVGALIYWR